jgi:hypothetical protein
MTEAEKLRRRAHELRVAGCNGWPILRAWRWWRADRLIERADVEEVFARYKRKGYWRPCVVRPVEEMEW